MFRLVLDQLKRGMISYVGIEWTRMSCDDMVAAPWTAERDVPMKNVVDPKNINSCFPSAFMDSTIIHHLFLL
jgi:hypothetical protein